MADLKSSLTLLMAFLLYSSVLLVELVSGFPEKGQKASENQFHTIEVSSLSTGASVCTRHSTALGSDKRPTSTVMEVFNTHGPCSHHQAATRSNTPPPSEAELLSSDRSRVEYLRARRQFDVEVKPTSETNRSINKRSNNNYDTSKSTVNPPIRPGDRSGLDNYVVNITLGSPPQELTLVFDTSSDLMLTRCGPHYEQGGILFSPNASTSYSSIPCKESSTLCSQLLPKPSCSEFNGTDTCEFSIQRGDPSYVNGFLSMDRLNISTDDVFPNFLFGCAQDYEGYFLWVPGLLGFGRGPLSFVSQTQETYGGMFSYCFPANRSSTGFLTLGRSDNSYSSNMKFTPLIASSSSSSSSLYILETTSISVGGFSKNVGPSISQTIIDSSTVITRLPPDVYIPMRDEFRKQMIKYRTGDPVENLLDTCYDTSGQSPINVPPVSFTFRDGVTVNLDPSGILYAIGGRVCFAFTQSEPEDHGLIIFGNTQQKTMEVVYDVPGGKLGFRPKAC
ncbi:hypothetical protein OROMI_020341 [Orobanche minor]